MAITITYDDSFFHTHSVIHDLPLNALHSFIRSFIQLFIHSFIHQLNTALIARVICASSISSSLNYLLLQCAESEKKIKQKSMATGKTHNDDFILQ